MDPIRNPYTPNAGSRPPELAGRDRELEQFRVLVGRLKRGATEQSMIIRGLRGVGKTVLLNAFEDSAESEGFLTYYHELTPDSSLIAEITRDAQAAIGRLKLSTRAVKAMREALSQLGTIKVVGPDGITLEVDLRKADEGTIVRDLSELFLQLGQAAIDKRSGVVFLLDEIQFANEVEYRAVISALHRATQKNLPITLAAAGLPQIPRLTGEARSYAERLFTFPIIANLDEPDARAAIVQPARQQKVEYDEQAIALALKWTDGYPFFIQQLGKHAWNLATQSPITQTSSRPRCPPPKRGLTRASTRCECNARRTKSAGTCARWQSSATVPTNPEPSPPGSDAKPATSPRFANGFSTKGSSTPPRTTVTSTSPCPGSQTS